MRRSLSLVALASQAALLAACGSAPPPVETPPAATSAAVPVATVVPVPPEVPATKVTLQGVGPAAAALDRTAAPCQDFSQFACGGWVAKTEIPADKPRYNRSFTVIQEENQAEL